MAVGTKGGRIRRAEDGRQSRLGRKAGLWILKILLLAVTGIASLIACEYAIRFASPQKASWLAIYRKHPELPFYGFQPNARQVVDTGETYWVVVTDANGDRVSRVEPDVEAATRPVTLCLGDSFSFAHGVDHSLSYVGRMHDEHRGGYRYVNAGVPGYGPIQYRHVLEHRIGQGMVPKRLLITSFMGNDFYDCVWNKDLPVTDGVLNKRSTWMHKLKEDSHLYRLSANIYHQFVSHDSAGQLQKRLETASEWDTEFFQKAEATYRDEFERIKAICAREGIELTVIIIPSREEVARLATPPSYATPELSESRTRARAIFSALGIRFVDCTDALSEWPIEEVFFRFDGHLTPLGHEIVDEQVMRVLTTGGPASSDAP